ncbi:serine-threonine kinase receptor-associated protein-like isoform X2 [Porites lutea]|uniref:serine-threonine kinase receptor-associated protein-like isoform X2 n=1 Tax=Porites lutea TaxID=51062 RepID=UPI003CC51B7E
MARQIPLTCSGHTRPVVHLSFSDITPYGYFLISACKDGKPMLRYGHTGDWIGTYEGHKGAVWSATLTEDATKAATGAADFTAKVWNAETGEELRSLPHKHIVKIVDFSPDGERLLTASNEKLIRIFDLQDESAEPDLFKGYTVNIRAALWSKNPTYIISGGEDKAMRMEQIKSFEAPTAIFSASLHPSKSCFVAGGDDFKLYKFDYEDGKELESYKGHFGPVHCVRYSPDGELYASGSEDGTLRLWQNTVGKTYGLWRAVNNGVAADGTNS